MKKYSSLLEKYTHGLVVWVGTSWGFALAVSTIVLWLIAGIIFRFNNNWQNWFETFTSLITFLMIFLVQRSQNKEFKAIQIKLNELIASQSEANNELINIETSTEEHIKSIHEMHERQR